MGIVLKYTVVHGLAFIAFGLVAAAGLFALADRDRRVLFAVFMLFCCLEVAALLMIFVLAERLLEDLAPWAILGANLLATVRDARVALPFAPSIAGRAPRRRRIDDESNGISYRVGRNDTRVGARDRRTTGKRAEIAVRSRGTGLAPRLSRLTARNRMRIQQLELEERRCCS